MRRSRLEILVGFFVILSLVIMAFMVFFISGVYVFKKGYRVDVIFNLVSNLEKGASVRLTGIPVGTVKQLGLEYDKVTGRPTVRTELFIDEKAKIHADSKIRVEGIYGLMTPYLEIRPGNDPNALLLKDGDTVKGVDPVPMEDFVATGKDIVQNLQGMVARLNDFTKDTQVTTSLRDTIINLDSLTKTMNSILNNKQGDVQKTITDLEAATEHLKNILEKIDAGQGTAGKLLSDEALYKELQDFVADLKKHPWKLLRKTDDGEEKGKRRKVLGVF